MTKPLTPEESRVLRREARGRGNLSKLDLITVTDKGRQHVAADDERVRRERAAGGGVREIGPQKRRAIASKAGKASARARAKASKA